MSQRMSQRKQIEVPLDGGGKALAVPQESVFNDEWLLMHPWGDQRFHGTGGEAKAELRRIVRENEAEGKSDDE